jgi:hypothetical protein
LDNVKIDKTLNLFSYLGETYLNLYTEVPQPIAIDAPTELTEHQEQYTFTAEVGATVCLSNENGIMAVKRATGEPQNIDLTPFDIGEHLTLTATKKNRFRFEQEVTVVDYSTRDGHTIDFNLYPNPTDGKVNLVIGETLQSKAIVEVYNLLGERMMTKNIGRLLQGETISLDLSHLVSGLYIVKLSTENGSCSKKVSVW